LIFAFNRSDRFLNPPLGVKRIPDDWLVWKTGRVSARIAFLSPNDAPGRGLVRGPGGKDHFDVRPDRTNSAIAWKPGRLDERAMPISAPPPPPPPPPPP